MQQLVGGTKTKGVNGKAGDVVTASLNAALVTLAASATSRYASGGLMASSADFRLAGL